MEVIRLPTETSPKIADKLLIEPLSFLKTAVRSLAPKRIVIGGSSANPTHLEHYALLEDIRFNKLDFDWLIWIPCGERPDKHFSVCPTCVQGPAQHCHVCVNHRIAMTEMTVGFFRNDTSLPHFSIWYDDIFGENTPTIVWLQQLVQMYPEAEITWMTGADSIVPLPEYDGRNEIQVRWKDGEILWRSRRWNWLVYERPGYSLSMVSLPDNVKIRSLPENHGISSSKIRDLIAGNDSSWETMVAPAVADYIKQWRLYGYRETSI